MNDVGGTISLYHNLFLICLISAIVCLIVAVALFFVLDIRAVIGYLTGRRAKKGIKELEAVTALSGRLLPKERTNMQYVAQEMKDDMGVRQRAKPGIRKVEHAVEAAPQPIVQTPQETAAPQVSYPVEQATDVLSENHAPYTAQMADGNASTAVLNEVTGVNGRFVIIRELMMIHTEEVI